MFRKRKLIRIIALFFTLELMLDIAMPYMSYALTSGPTAPEATSFEPVDTTDMVNLLTGDFTYNLPLLEVPGPSGGYPLSLSYHAGIQPEQQASWVGLGWTLNPGAITRIVNGYPDDYKSVENSTREFWEGGESETWSAGVSVGLANGPTVSAGLSWGQDTYRGFGMGGYLGASLSANLGQGDQGVVGIGGGATVSFFDYDNDSEKGSINFSYGIGLALTQQLAPKLNGSVGVNFGSGGFGANAGVNYSTPNTAKKGLSNGRSMSLVGASLSTGKGGSSSLSVGGGTASANNSNAGKISTSSSGFSVDIPTPVPGINLRLSRQYVRYWSDNLDNVKVNGSLYHLDTKEGSSSFYNSNAFDTYDLHDERRSVQDFGTDEKILGGSFSDYDSYSVNAQGLGGTMRPYHLQKIVNRQNKIYDGSPEIVNYIFNNNGENASIVKPAKFRFVDDFSNSHIYNEADFKSSAGNIFEFEVTDGTYHPKNGIIKNNVLAGSRHIEYYTNSQAYNGTAYGLIKARNYTPRYSPSTSGEYFEYNHQIYGFKITNESGVNYHYSLPVYAENEIIYSGQVDDEGVKSFNQLRKKTGYAYTWYLTGITGPDYVDRGPDGVPNGAMDESDWGYWVSFEYGKWTDGYGWRNPDNGFHRDLDQDYEFFTKGEKELYYLNYIRTKTHTAVFEKSIRKDGKGVVHELSDAAVTVNNATKEISNVDEGGFDVKVVDGCTQQPRSLLKLDNIYLIANKDFDRNQADLLVSADGTYNHVYGSGDCQKTFHYGNNVVDKHDIASSFDKTNTIRTIRLNTDYSLTKDTPNSFISEIDVLNTADASDNTRDGRLGLKSIEYFGKENVGGLLPPIRFEYGTGAKNPNYEAKNGDIWGFYKSDFDVNEVEENDNEGRTVTDNSAQNVDAWSLTGIVTNLGSKIKVNYESDVYRVPDAFKSYHINIIDIQRSANFGKIKVSFDVNESSFFNVGQYIEFVCLIENEAVESRFNTVTNCSPFTSTSYSYNNYSINGTIIEKSSNHVVIEAITLYNNLGPYSDGLCDDVNSTNCRNCTSVAGTRSFLAGNMLVAKENGDILGGGLRVKSLTIDDQTMKRSTLYDYEVDGHTSGITSYEPKKIETVILDGEKLNVRDLSSVIPERREAVKDYLSLIFGKTTSRVLTISRDIPGPGVYYGLVTVREEINREGTTTQLPSYSEFEFQVFDPNQIGIVRAQEIDDRTGAGGTDANTGQVFQASLSNKVTMKDFSSQLGKLKRMTLYDENGNKMTETINHYLHDTYDQDFVDANGLGSVFEAYEQFYVPELDSRFDNQGVVHETFANARFVKQGEDGLLSSTLNPNEFYALGVISKRERYPAIPTGVTTINHKTGVSATTSNLGFDYYSGIPTKTLKSDSYGNHYLSETTPAYKVYPEMGLAINFGANMLTQEAYSSTYKVDDIGSLNPTGLVHASTQTWSRKVEELGNHRIIDVMSYEQNSGNPYALDAGGPQIFKAGDIFRFRMDGFNFKCLVTGVQGSNATSWLYYLKFLGLTPAFSSGTMTSIERLGVYRKHKSYSFIGNENLENDGLFNYDTYTANPFDYWGHDDEPATALWQKNSEVKLYDVHSHALEAIDVNGNYASTQMDKKQEKVLATVANANYEEFIYSGAENWDGVSYARNVQVGNGTVVPVSHTGASSVRLETDERGLLFTVDALTLGRTYRISVWTDSPDGRLVYRVGSGGGFSELPNQYSAERQANGWYLLQADFISPFGEGDGVFYTFYCQSNVGTAHFDDLRFHPIDATMTSYVYNEWGELEYILDANNIYTKYEYDAMGRLAKTFRETFEHDAVWASNVDYHYKSDQDLTFQGDVAFSRLDYNTYNLRVDFDTQGSRNYSSVWNIGGTTFNRSGNSISYDVSSEGNKDVIVQITDNNSGLSFMAYDRIYFDICPTPGTTLGSYCEVDSDGCYTTWVITRKADGLCGEYLERENDDTVCNNNGNLSCAQ